MKIFPFFFICAFLCLFVSNAFSQCTCSYSYNGTGNFAPPNNQTLCITGNVTDLNLQNWNGNNTICIAAPYTLTLNNNINFSGNGGGSVTIQVQSGATLIIGGNPAFNATTTFSVANGGVMRVTANGAYFPDNFNINNSGLVEFTGSDATLTNANGTITNSTTGVFKHTGTGTFKFLNSGSIVNNGTMLFSNILNNQGTASFTNTPTGTLTIQRQFFNHGSFTNNGNVNLPCATGTGIGTGSCGLIIGDKGANQILENNKCLTVNGDFSISGLTSNNGVIDVVKPASGTGDFTVNKELRGTGRVIVENGTSTLNSDGRWGSGQQLYDKTGSNNGNFDFNYSNFNNAASITINRSPSACGSFTFTGKIFDDGNGLTDNTVNGTPFNLGNTLYASLVNTEIGRAEQTVAVATDGSYSFATSIGSYQIILHTTPGGSTTAALPAGWVNTGENLGSGAGNDGSVNGILLSNGLNITAATTANITNANLGVDSMAVTSNYSYYGGTNPPGTGQANVTSNAFGGRDREDGTYTQYLTGRKVTIYPSFDASCNVFYNGAIITAPLTVDHFDDNAVNVDPAATGTTTARFKYAVWDNANVQGFPGLVQISFGVNILPVTGLQLQASRSGSDVKLVWSTLTEQNTADFIIEKSTDGVQFTSLTTVPAAGNSNVQKTYTTTDANVLMVVAYYRVRLMNKDGKTIAGSIAVVRMAASPKSVQVFPNPAYGQLFAIFTTAGSYQVELINAEGRQVLSKKVEPGAGQTITIDRPAGLAKGMYLMQIYNATTGTREALKVELK